VRTGDAGYANAPPAETWKQTFYSSSSEAEEQSVEFFVE